MAAHGKKSRRCNIAGIRAESDYRTEQGYPSVLTKDTRESYLRRVSALKKFTSSVLWLSTSTRREGTTLEQVLFAIAAGVAMVFATLVAFYAQSIYGQFSLPVFVALVVAYMFKDRIKEQGRTWSSSLLSRHLYDYRTVIETQDGRRQLGNVREKVGYLKAESIPPEVIATRGAGPHDEPTFVGHLETVLMYAKLVTLRKDAFAFLAEDGVEILLDLLFLRPTHCPQGQVHQFMQCLTDLIASFQLGRGNQAA